MHSCIYVLIDGDEQVAESLVANALDPFNEAHDVPPYKDHLSRSCTRYMAEHFKVPDTELQALAGKMPEWRGVPGGVDELGLFAICTSNPDGKWDWYEIGGRWDGFITGRKQPNSDLIQNNSIVASTLLKARDFAKRLPAGIVTPTGEWIERTSLVTTSNGWYLREIPKRVWCNRVRRILAAFPRYRVVCVDAHN